MSTVVSRTPARAQALVEVARGLGVDADVGGADDVARRRHRLHVHDERRAAVRRRPAGRRARTSTPWAATNPRRESSTPSRCAGPGSWSRRAMRRSRRPASCASRSARARSAATTCVADLARGRARRRGPDVAGRRHGLQVRGVGVRGSDRGTRGGGRGQGRRMTETADVVVVGGGVVGASTAYHLAAAGVERVVLLERADSVATGSTGACAGGFRHQFSSRINIELSLASVPMILGFTRGARAAARRRAGRVPVPGPRRAGLGATSGRERSCSARSASTRSSSRPTRPRPSRPASRSTTSWVRRSAPTTASRTPPG